MVETQERGEGLKVEGWLRFITLFELVFPTILLILGIYNGLLQVLYRAGIIKSMSFLGISYYQGLTLHGVINAIVFTTFFIVAFSNLVMYYYTRIQLSKGLTYIAFALMVVGTLLAAIPMLIGKANVLYTFYPPLKAHPMFYIGAALLVVGTWVAFLSYILVYLKWKKENPQKGVPLGVIGVMSTFIIWFVATVPLAYAVLFMLIPWSLGIVKEINIMVERTLFWFFGHPLVYFWLLPSYIMLYVVLPKIAGGKLFSEKFARLVFMLFIIFSIPVGVHHQYSDPSIGTSMKFLHGVLTFAVAIPSFLTAFNVAASLEYAGRKNGGNGIFGWWKKLPYTDPKKYLFAYMFAGLVLFLFGGITGIVNASYNLNSVVHNTAWVPGHFHTTVGGLVFLSFLGMSLYLVQKLLGKEVKFQRLNVLVPYMWLIGVILMSTGMSIPGIEGMPRRTNIGLTYLNPESEFFRPGWVFWSYLSVIGGTIMFISMFSYFVIFFSTLFSKKTSEADLYIPTAQSLDDAGTSFSSFKPWIAILIVLILVAYIPTFYDLSKATFGGAPPYSPELPVPMR
ncbi:MAG: cbb3-type cytochrome c oxidase subunit I [Candidatus Calescibacterium sp.]|nr:cbb3-type cytochrome c oxidase subunit I [Candidatus Calescibacterium sp.]MCX7734022.1 cbb3-type cytochrome c oxidase subunit I [bacterium]MDW8086379.1 cbb3-type cytochrome c oxidase subunit I [Candidatus Calescibacterium sp.]